MEQSYFNKEDVFIRPIHKNIAKGLIVKNHYSHKWTMCSYALGVFLKNQKNEMFEENVDDLIGCVVYGGPVGRSSAMSICDNVSIQEVIELTRLWIKDGVGKNIESYVISQSLKWLKNNTNIKIILSYADDEQGHLGTIYQATNFLFTGRNSDTNLMPNYSISLSGPETGYKWIHSRTVSATYGSHNVEHLKKCIGHTFYRKKEASKLRYIYIIAKDKDKRLILKNLKHKSVPYPKNNNIDCPIEKVVVNNFGVIEKNSFFDFD
jgi:hypothetical protein